MLEAIKALPTGSVDNMLYPRIKINISIINAIMKTTLLYAFVVLSKFF